MFVSPNIPCGMKSVTLKIEAESDVETRVAHATCQVEPFTPALAHELGEDVFDHLFTTDPRDSETPMPRPEIVEVGFNLRCGLQRIVARSHPELEPDATLANVKVDRVRVTRPDEKKPRLALSFVLSIDLSERRTVAWIVKAFARVNYLTFEREQLDLIDDDVRETRADRLNNMSVKVGDEWKPVTPENVAAALSAGLRGEPRPEKAVDIQRERLAVAARRGRNAGKARKARR